MQSAVAGKAILKVERHRDETFRDYPEKKVLRRFTIGCVRTGKYRTLLCKTLTAFSIAIREVRMYGSHYIVTKHLPVGGGKPYGASGKADHTPRQSHNPYWLSLT